MEEESPWQLDDKEWVKQRKEQWKWLKARVDNLSFLGKDERKSLKGYFIEGKVDQNCPLERMEAWPLLKMWLHPEQSDERWQQIKASAIARGPGVWGYAIFRFQDIAGRRHSQDDMAPHGESFFSGMEERLCRFFHLDRCRREDHLDKTDEQFLLYAEHNLKHVRNFNGYINDEKPEKYCIIRFYVPAWQDAMKIAFKEDYLGLEWMINDVESVLSNPKKRPAFIVELAKELDEALRDPEFSDEAKALIQKYRKKG